MTCATNPPAALELEAIHIIRETDIWAYANDIELPPLYYAYLRPVVERGGALVVVDDKSRMHFLPGEQMSIRNVRFCKLACWPVTGAIDSDASDLRVVVDETLRASSSERQGRVSDGEDGRSLKQKKREGCI